MSCATQRNQRALAIFGRNFGSLFDSFSDPLYLVLGWPRPAQSRPARIWINLLSKPLSYFLMLGNFFDASIKKVSHMKSARLTEHAYNEAEFLAVILDPPAPHWAQGGGEDDRTSSVGRNRRFNSVHGRSCSVLGRNFSVWTEFRRAQNDSQNDPEIVPKCIFFYF